MNNILVIDNYDSFTYNLVHYLEDLGADVTVYRNDEFTIEEVASFDKILLSPGPGLPEAAGLMNEVIRTYAGSKSILGICLGQQAIAEVFGATLINLEKVYHGIASNIVITVNDETLFQGLAAQISVGRYHSWTVSGSQFPEQLEATSVDENGEIMSLRHRVLDVKGVQFHPESILTPEGKTILKNWLQS